MEVDEHLAFGIMELASAPSPTVDIVAIHGLKGHREQSWTADNGKLWLRDFLPESIPAARILSYGYDAYTESRTAQTLDGQADDLLAKLSMTRRDTRTEERPLIFIAHCLGGLILKSALIQASAPRENHLSSYHQIYLSTIGILFLGTPHQGTDAVPKLLSLCRQGNNTLLKNLEFDSEPLQRQIDVFPRIAQNFHTTFFYETFPTNIGTSSSLIVPKSSATVPGAVNVQSIGLHKDHFTMCKFQSISDNDFETVADILIICILDHADRPIIPSEDPGARYGPRQRNQILHRTPTSPTGPSGYIESEDELDILKKRASKILEDWKSSVDIIEHQIAQGSKLWLRSFVSGVGKKVSHWKKTIDGINESD